MKPIKHIGVWWLPSEPENRVTGTLEGDGVSRPTLALFGLFREVMDTSGFRPEILLGLVEDGTLITLCNCHRTQNKMRFGGISVSSFDVGVVLTGQHFDTIDEIRFTSVAGAFQHLGDWTGFDPVTLTVVPPNPQGPPGIDLSARHLGPLKAMAGDIEVALGVDLKHEFRPTVRHAIALTHWMTLTPPNAIGLDEYFKLTYAAQTFIAFGLRWPTQPDEVRCRTTKSPDDRHDVHLHYAIVPSRLAAKWPEHPVHRCFQSGQIAASFGECVGKWLAMPPGLDTVRSLFFSRTYAAAIYSENDYLNLVQAIEAFHRETRGGRFITRPQWKAVRGALWGALDQESLPLTPEARCTLKQRLSHLAEHNLGSRLESLLEEFKEFTEVFIPDREAFIRLVLKMRNYWTHFDSKRAASQLDGYELHILTTRLEALMELCWMSYVGIPNAVMASVAARCKESVDETERLNKPSPPPGGLNEGPVGP